MIIFWLLLVAATRTAFLALYERDRVRREAVRFLLSPYYEATHFKQSDSVVDIRLVDIYHRINVVIFVYDMFGLNKDFWHIVLLFAIYNPYDLSA